VQQQQKKRVPKFRIMKYSNVIDEVIVSVIIIDYLMIPASFLMIPARFSDDMGIKQLFLMINIQHP
jgi:hypothetical protein